MTSFIIRQPRKPAEQYFYANYLMSTIVAVRKRDQICIAADSLTCFGDTKQSSRYEKSHDKIHTHGENRIGIVGSAAHQIVIESLLSDSSRDFAFSSRMAIFESFRQLHPILKDDYYLNPKDEDDDPYESTRIDALIINPDGLFAVFSLREVFEYTRFWAIGSGGDIALGAMFAMYDRLDSAEEIARIGVEAGAEFNNATALPLSCYSMKLTGTG